MRYPVILVAALAVPSWAQFSQLTATDDGQQVYFLSPLVLKGSSAPSEARLFRLAPDGLSLFAERGMLAAPGSRSSSDGVSGPQVSGDGSIVGFTMHNACTSIDNCGSLQRPVPAEAEIRGKQSLNLGPGTLQLSRNGRWALVTPPFGFDPQTGNPAQASALLIDLSTNQGATVPSPPQAMDGSAVASDGTVVVLQTSTSGSLAGLWKQGQFTAITSAPGTAIRVLALSDDAGTLILSILTIAPGTQNTLSLTARHLATGQDTTLFSTASLPFNTQFPVLMGLSNDGRRALYRVQAGQPAGAAYISDTLTGTSTAIALSDGELVVDGTLSGAGDAAFLVTTKGRLLRIMQGLAAETLIPATPYISNVNPLPAGSFVRLHGPFDGTVADWAQQLVLNDRPLPVLAVQSGELDVQIPWEARLGTGSLRFANPGNTPFETSQTVFVTPIFMAPEFGAATGTGFLGLKMVKGDFSGLVTAAPAPGDIFHLYMTGLGPVQGPVETGVPASLTAPNPILGTVVCRFQPGSSDTETLFAGLAPGMIGFYQVSLRMPADAGAAPVRGFGCDLKTSAGGGSFQIIGAGLGQ